MSLMVRAGWIRLSAYNGVVAGSNPAIVLAGDVAQWSEHLNIESDICSHSKFLRQAVVGWLSGMRSDRRFFACRFGNWLEAGWIRLSGLTLLTERRVQIAHPNSIFASSLN